MIMTDVDIQCKKLQRCIKINHKTVPLDKSFLKQFLLMIINMIAVETY